MAVGLGLGWGPSCVSEPRHGTCYLFLILAAVCGFPAVTGLRVETGTNEQLHPAWLPGIMGLQTDRASVLAAFLHSRFVIPSLPRVHPYLCSSPMQRFNYLFPIFLFPGR